MKYIIHNEQVFNGKYYLVHYKCTVLWAVLLQLQLFRIAIVAGVVVTTSGAILVYSCNLDTVHFSLLRLKASQHTIHGHCSSSLSSILSRNYVCDPFLIWRGGQHVGCAIYSTVHPACFLWLRWARCHRGLCDYTKQGVFNK